MELGASGMSVHLLAAVGVLRWWAPYRAEVDQLPLRPAPVQLVPQPVSVALFALAASLLLVLPALVASWRLQTVQLGLFGPAPSFVQTSFPTKH